ncbi:MAG: hypothetical protein AB6733_12240 [Clostridiaceae bacterium]
MKVVKAIPYKSFKQKVQIVKKLERKGYRVEVNTNYIYAERG